VIRTMGIVAGIAMTLGGCASVTSGTTQTVTVTPVCEGSIIQSAACTLANNKGKWDIVSPGPVVIQKSYDDLAVVCRKDGAMGSATFVSKPNSGVWGNIIAGGLIGYAIDSSNGAGYNYPAEMPVIMQAPCPGARPAASPAAPGNTITTTMEKGKQ
jgi:hypothetical protein